MPAQHHHVRADENIFLVLGKGGMAHNNILRTGWARWPCDALLALVCYRNH